MAITEHYVNPAINANSGAGSVGDPWGDYQYGLDQQGGAGGHDAVNGTRFNIKTGTDEVLAAALDFSTYGTATFTATAPFVTQGYTTAAGDGGQGGIDANAGSSIISNANMNGVFFLDMHLHNTGSDPVVRLDNSCVFIRSEIDNAADHGIHVDSNGIVIGCYIHNVDFSGVECDSALVYGNYFEDGANKMARAVSMDIAVGGNGVIGNVVKLNDAGTVAGIEILHTSIGCVVIGNSIYNATAGTGAGILLDAAQFGTVVAGNLIEGFSGVGGIGISIPHGVAAVMANGIFNCTTPVSGANILLSEDNELPLGATPFASKTTFQPNDTGEVLAVSNSTGAWPRILDIGVGNIIRYLDKGAVQLEPSAGGGGGIKLAGRGGLCG